MLAAGVFLVIGCLVVLLAGLVATGALPFDVKGRLLTGAMRVGFSAAVAALGAIALGAAYGVWHGRRWGGALAVGFWAAGGLFSLAVDRAVPGPNEPLRTYLIDMLLLPALATALLVWGLPWIARRLN